MSGWDFFADQLGDRQKEGRIRKYLDNEKEMWTLAYFKHKAETSEARKCQNKLVHFTFFLFLCPQKESLIYNQIFSYRVTVPPSGHRLDVQPAISNAPDSVSNCMGKRSWGGHCTNPIGCIFFAATALRGIRVSDSASEVPPVWHVRHRLRRLLPGPGSLLRLGRHLLLAVLPHSPAGQEVRQLCLLLIQLLPNIDIKNFCRSAQYLCHHSDIISEMPAANFSA